MQAATWICRCTVDHRYHSYHHDVLAYSAAIVTELGVSSSALIDAQILLDRLAYVVEASVLFALVVLFTQTAV
jgi:hypothetical protein